jgi:omega-amidase
MQNLSITLLQTSLHWQSREANLAMLSEKLGTVSPGTDLIVLPEMFSTGFSMAPAGLAEHMDGPSVAWMREKARLYQVVVTGSLIIEEEGRFYNRLLWVRPDGSFEKYDKRHLFRMAGEDQVYTAGREKLVVELKGWRICPLICYDLRFPVWSRNVGNEYDLLLYVANWPAARAQAWKALLPARAVENLAYCVGLNRIGQDGKGIAYAGDSMVVDPKGQALLSAAQVECMPTLTLSKEELTAYRDKFPAHLDADGFEIR